MDATNSFWVMQPTSVRLLLLGLLGVAAISVVRSARLARRLYRYSGEPTSLESIVDGRADPDLVAASALAGQALCTTVLGARAVSQPPLDRAGVEGVHCVLRAAENKFSYLWEKCYSDVQSIKSASMFSFLLSLVMVAYGAFPTYSRFYNNSNRPGSLCLFLTVEQLFLLLALGWSCCVALYLAASFFERTLADRKTCWKYLCSRMTGWKAGTAEAGGTARPGR